MIQASIAARQRPASDHAVRARPVIVRRRRSPRAPRRPPDRAIRGVAAAGQQAHQPAPGGRRSVAHRSIHPPLDQCAGPAPFGILVDGTARPRRRPDLVDPLAAQFACAAPSRPTPDRGAWPPRRPPRKPQSSMRPTSTKRSSTALGDLVRDAALSATRVASAALGRAAAVSSRRQIAFATASGSPGASSGCPPGSSSPPATEPDGADRPLRRSGCPGRAAVPLTHRTGPDRRSARTSSGDRSRPALLPGRRFARSWPVPGPPRVSSGSSGYHVRPIAGVSIGRSPSRRRPERPDDVRCRHDGSEVDRRGHRLRPRRCGHPRPASP